MNEKTEYKVVTTVEEILDYIGDASVAAFDYETAPDDKYRDEDKAALDPAKSHIVTMSISVQEHTGIMIPVAHKIGKNIDKDAFVRFLTDFLMNPKMTKVAHNLSFEAMFSYGLGIVVQAPVYDTIAASQMSLKSGTEFRELKESGLKKLAGELCEEPLPSFASVLNDAPFSAGRSSLEGCK